MCLSSCTTTSYNSPKKLLLPEMPIAGKEVATELSTNCKKCPKTMEWLSELYWFRIEYSSLLKELNK